MADWKAISRALDTGTPDDQLERLAPILDQLERAFEPLRAKIPLGADVWTPE